VRLPRIAEDVIFGHLLSLRRYKAGIDEPAKTREAVIPME